MAESDTVLNSKIGFLDTRLALIHVPLEAYSHFVLPISQLLFHNPLVDEDGKTIEASRPWTYWHPFVNVSVTTNECSIVCPRRQADELFAPIIPGLSESLQQRVSISQEDFAAIVITGSGLEAGQRVLDLTSPLALAGIPIFFITSYHCDFILVALNTRSTVIRALEERGFVFEVDDTPGEAGHMINPASPVMNPRHRTSSASSFDFPRLPGTPPPSTVPELQERTFRLLKKHNISPVIDDSTELVTCAGIKDYTHGNYIAKFTGGKMTLGLMHCLSQPSPPRFFSLTLTTRDSASLTIERSLLDLFPDRGDDVLLGTDGPGQIPITLDLRGLPLESTGIVCGLSSRLIDGMKGHMVDEVFNMSYLSTARAGHVIVYENELADAIKALNSL
ncbi:hypothetical protein AMS68_007467 [Peltaster fructicola]|uniref:CASTOR ACT domain-containing protein n=1 Tax=Peltaster fructicola TaxID=286661 RepID=A0A6H0Y5T0_9PEZI|nr:hypothetical protein AMS68_007467 [Peltaster fructicola]